MGRVLSVSPPAGNDLGIRINGTLYVFGRPSFTWPGMPSQSWWLEIADQYGATHNYDFWYPASSQEEAAMAAGGIVLDVGGSVYVDGVYGLQSDGTLGGPGGYLASVKNTVSKVDWITYPQYELDVIDTIEFYALGVVPSAYSGGIRVSNLALPDPLEWNVDNAAAYRNGFHQWSAANFHLRGYGAATSFAGYANCGFLSLLQAPATDNPNLGATSSFEERKLNMVSTAAHAGFSPGPTATGW